MPLASLVALKKLNANNNAPRFARRLRKLNANNKAPRFARRPKKAKRKQ